jgi:hypothetical protein
MHLIVPRNPRLFSFICTKADFSISRSPVRDRALQEMTGSDLNSAIDWACIGRHRENAFAQPHDTDIRQPHDSGSNLPHIPACHIDKRFARK